MTATMRYEQVLGVLMPAQSLADDRDSSRLPYLGINYDGDPWISWRKIEEDNTGITRAQYQA